MAEKTALRAHEDCVIPANFLGHITVCGSLVNQKLDGGLREKGPIIPRCVVNTEEEGRTILPVLNIIDEPITIKVGDKVTRGEACEEQVCRRQITKPVRADEVDTDLSGKTAEELVLLLNEHKDLVARNIHQVGCIEKASMRIQVTADKTIYYRLYRLSYHERKQLSDLVDDLKQGIVEDSVSPYASPVLLVRKKSGEIRMCMDYRSLNRTTMRDQYPLPLIDDQLDREVTNILPVSICSVVTIKYLSAKTVEKKPRS